MNSIFKRAISVSALALTTSFANANISFNILPIEGRVGGTHGWVEVSDNGTVVFAKYKENGYQDAYGLREMQGFAWSKTEGVSLVSDSFGISLGSAPQYVSISNDGNTMFFGNQVYRNNQLALTTNVGADKHLTTLSPDGNNVGIRSYYDGPSVQNIDSEAITPVGTDLPHENYHVADYSNNSETILLSSNSTNFLGPNPFFIRNPDGTLYEIPQQFGSIADLSGNGSTVIGRSFICEEFSNCTIVSNPAGAIEIGESAYFPEAINYDGSVAVLSYRDYANNDWSAHVWDEANGIRSLVDLLAAQGVDISNWTQVRMYDISDNGHYIVGEGKNSEGLVKTFIIDATPQCSPNSLL